ncbi:FAD dependent oxidoreductase [Penicillium maclennaniae]|uniref:FAD dependent oxidoreductase n=1 Tax=Penicillium maclennaniae TaxID=1343394 RepID=UPI00254040AD|nr:FAD dependent oxidoreductase [Penicillium maclennaniae]KAJ5670542.1 FAD dependent oxidoreductase [Penicillium maclennaniae]
MPNNIVVLGAGVSGLTTAYLLSKDPANQVTEGSKHQEWERNTWAPLKALTEKHPEAGIHFLNTLIYNRKKDQGSATGDWFSELVKPNPWYKDVVPDFQTIAKDKLSGEMDNAQQFTSVCINTAVYLPWLVGQCVKNGAVFKRAVLKHITEAATAHHTGQPADVVVNCTGLASKTLGGVADDKMYPARGQIVIVRNDAGSMYSASGTDDGPDEALYLMTRAMGGGTILGGTYQKHNWDALPDPNIANRIMKRAIAAAPQLVKQGQGIEGLDIIRHGVGLRPLREGGPRLEKDEVEGVNIVHNYGHGGFGYQASFGCANEVVTLVKEDDDLALRVQKVLKEFGSPPLAGTPLAPKVSSPEPEILLAMIIDAMLKSRPIQHDLSRKTVNHLIEMGYHDVNKLSETTWEERTDVLREVDIIGIENRLRPTWVRWRNGDLNKLLERGEAEREKVGTLIKDIKGVGDLAEELFLSNVQSVWPSMAPFVDSRSLKTADEIGIGRDLEVIYDAVQHDPMKMSQLANGLSTVRLEHRQQDITM